MSVAEISAVIGGGVLLVAVAVLLVKASVRFGRLETKVDGLTEAVNKMVAEVRQTNTTMIALANHRHDVDGNTVFTVPG